MSGDCNGVAEELLKFVTQMTIPPLQGMIRYFYLADPMVNGGSCTDGVCTYDKSWAEGWAFAAAVLPQIDRCDKSVAQLVNDNINVDGVETPMKDGYEYVKAWVETTYECLGLTCADVGEYQDSNGVVFPGMDACMEPVSPPVSPGGSKSKKSSNKSTLIIIIVVVVVAVALLVFVAGAMRYNANKNKPAEALPKDVEMHDDKPNSMI